MEEVRFSDWPDPPGNGAWLPAYGFQQNDLSDKDDFLNPAEAVLLASGVTMPAAHHALYLETIVEETSDDLRSENSSLSHGQGWFSDSDADSVIHVSGRDLDECDSGSERDFMCPPKRRRRNIIQTDCPPFSNPPPSEPYPTFRVTSGPEPFQYRTVSDCHLTDSTSDDNDSLTLSRSSSLVQFENIEKSCSVNVDAMRDSPSVYSQISFDSLEKTPLRESVILEEMSPKMSPDSLEMDDWKDDNDSDEFSGDSSDSDRTVDEKRKYNFKSCRSLDALPSFESLDDSCMRKRSPRRTGNQFSAENLSEDSGYSDHSCFMRQKSKSNPSVNFSTKDVGEKRAAAAAGVRHTGIESISVGKRRSAVSVPCLAHRSPAAATRAASVPADLNLCIGADRSETIESAHAHSFSQTFRVHESFTTSVADLTALDYRGSARRMAKPDGRTCIRIPLRESSAESDSTTESERAFLKEMELTLRTLDEKTADMLEKESPKPFDAVIAELQKKQHQSPPRFEFDYYGEDPDPADYSRRRDASGSTTERSSPDSDHRYDNRDNLLFFTSTPVKESDKVRSAPNLNALERERRSGGEDRPLGILGGRSQGLSGSGSTTRGVHFCPVVAEVSWREVSCSDDSQLADDDSTATDHSDDPDDPDDPDDHDDHDELALSGARARLEPSDTNNVGVSTWSGSSERDAAARGRERAWATPAERERDSAAAPVATAAAPVRRGTESAQHATPPNTTSSAAMQETRGPVSARSRIGGFLSRFANFRFSSRKEPKGAKAKAAAAAAAVAPPAAQPSHVQADFVRIPLKEPPPNKARSLLALAADQLDDRRPHKSMEYLLDKDNLRVIEPPENDLQKNSDRVLSEHELRVQRSLQKLNIPDWYKNAPAPREGFLQRKRLSDAASSPSSHRWPALSCKTTSLGSLGGGPPLPVPVPQLSPANTTFGRWSTSRLNSSQTSPCSSTRSSVRGTVSPLCSPSTRSSFSTRTPYLGWRSQERLSGRPRTPHERLAISLLPQNSTQSKASEEIQSSIKEVTSAIVHYVSGLEPGNSDDHRAPSPRGSQKLCWVESSFVGTKPLESPQTPSVPLTLPPAHPRPPSSLRLELHHRQGNGESVRSKLV